MAPKIVVPYRREDKLQAYVEAIETVGLDAVPVHAESGTAPEVMEGLYLTGGSDVNPALYGEERHALTEEPDEARDALEIGLLRRALSAQLPVLGICRGLQLWNVALGGKLIQHLPKEAGHTVPTLDQVHWVKPVGGSILESLLGSAPLLVNSRHHQAADPQHLGEGLVVSAWSRDGVVEALEMPRMKFAMAVQWHPEELWRRDRRLFEGYAKAALGEAWPLLR